MRPRDRGGHEARRNRLRRRTHALAGRRPALSPARAKSAKGARGGAAAKAAELLRRLDRDYPDARCSLDHRDPFELLAATILSAQCTDARVNRVTPALFRRFPDAFALARATQEEVEELVRTTGFFRHKAKNLRGMAAALVERHGGRVPADMDALLELPGVARKTANVVLGNAFGVPCGVVVDTHVGRLVRRLGLVRAADPVRVERALLPLVPEAHRVRFSHQLIEHGRAVCVARAPRCDGCAWRDLCAYGASAAASRKPRARPRS